MEAKKNFLEVFDTAFQKEVFVKMVLSKSAQKDTVLHQIHLRPVALKRGNDVQFLFRYKTKDETKNFSLSDALVFLQNELGNNWRQADLFLKDKQFSLLSSKKGKCTLVAHKAALALEVNTEHNHQKKTNLNPHGNLYLRELGILGAEGQALKDGQKKFRQIHHYLEILSPLMEGAVLSEHPFIADFGSGKGYLSFALFDYLLQKGYSPNMVGIELRDNLVQLCNNLAIKMNWSPNLQFRQTDIKDFDARGLDMLIALHACDTATDLAIAKGIEVNARLIVTVPCCHKQVRKDWQAPDWLNGIYKNGIQQERQAEILTDSIRALLMEAFGYQVSVTEFISTEHTPKNVMIAGVKKKKYNKRALEEVRVLMEKFGVKRHFLLEYLTKQGLLPI